MYEPLPADPQIKAGALQAQAAEGRHKRLLQLERDILATLPQDALDIISRAFAVNHGRQSMSDWPSWLGKTLPCPVSDLSIDALHAQVMADAGEK